jgi:hypothetical protein
MYKHILLPTDGRRVPKGKLPRHYLKRTDTAGLPGNPS